MKGGAMSVSGFGSQSRVKVHHSNYAKRRAKKRKEKGELTQEETEEIEEFKLNAQIAQQIYILQEAHWLGSMTDEDYDANLIMLQTPGPDPSRRLTLQDISKCNASLIEEIYTANADKLQLRTEVWGAYGVTEGEDPPIEGIKYNLGNVLSMDDYKTVLKTIRSKHDGGFPYIAQFNEWIAAQGATDNSCKILYDSSGFHAYLEKDRVTAQAKLSHYIEPELTENSWKRGDWSEPVPAAPPLTVAQLIEAGVPVQVGELCKAVKESNLVEVNNLLERGADPNETDGGWSALRLAALRGRRDIVEVLVKAGASEPQEAGQLAEAAPPPVVDVDPPR